MYIYLILTITQNMLLSDFLCVFAELRIFIEKYGKEDNDVDGK